MLVSALVILSLAVLLGAILLTPRRNFLARLRRRPAASMHGALGASGLAVFLLASGGAATSATWLAEGLLAAGLVAGGMIFLTCRHKRPPPVLILALHIIFAGIGYLLLTGLILG